MKCILSLFVIPLMLASGIADAQNSTGPAEQVASAFLRAFDSDDLASTYQTYTGPTFQKGSNSQMFVQQGGIMRIQLGGPAKSRQLVGSQAFNQLPGSPITGDFYYVRYKSLFPAAPAFQDVYLEKAGAGWKVAGFWFLPAPPN
jgi:hypothetical protein